MKMGKVYQGKMDGTKLKVAIVVARFNDLVTRNLLEGAQGTLRAHGVKDGAIDVVWVPGAFEIPIATQIVAEKQYDAVIALGAVIRGNTPHFDYVCNEVAKGISHVALTTKKPVIFGVITTDNIEQAFERAGTTGGNKGADAANAAIEMANLMQEMSVS